MRQCPGVLARVARKSQSARLYTGRTDHDDGDHRDTRCCRCPAIFGCQRLSVARLCRSGAGLVALRTERGDRAASICLCGIYRQQRHTFDRHDRSLRDAVALTDRWSVCDHRACRDHVCRSADIVQFQCTGATHPKSTADLHQRRDKRNHHRSGDRLCALAIDSPASA